MWIRGYAAEPRTTEAAHGYDPATAAEAPTDATADATAARTTGTSGTARCTPKRWNERQPQQLNLRGFDNIETFSGGEEQWQNWWWEIKTAVSGMNGELVEMLSAAETHGIENTEEILGEEQFVDANPERCTYASRETCNVPARCTSSEALTIVKSVT